LDKNKNCYPIKKQVCTTEQAKELAELLGEHAPESLWVWAQECFSETWELYFRKNCAISDGNPPIAAAYTGDELGALLPSHIKNGEFQLKIIKEKDKFIVGYEDEGEYPYETPGMYCWGEAKGEILAHVCADLAIMSIKNKNIKPEEFKYG
jgi:hypothetical protein